METLSSPCIENAMKKGKESVQCRDENDDGQGNGGDGGNAAVTFYPQVLVKTVPSRRCYSVEERRSYWYRSTDWKRIRREVWWTVNRMEDDDQSLTSTTSMSTTTTMTSDGGEDDDSWMEQQDFEVHEFCCRGLESHTSMGKEMKLNNRFNAIRAVLDEQVRQREKGIVDPARIALIYRTSSYKCQVMASRQGAVDERNSRSDSSSVDHATTTTTTTTCGGSSTKNQEGSSTTRQKLLQASQYEDEARFNLGVKHGISSPPSSRTRRASSSSCCSKAAICSPNGHKRRALSTTGDASRRREPSTRERNHLRSLCGLGARRRASASSQHQRPGAQSPRGRQFRKTMPVFPSSRR